MFASFQCARCARRDQRDRARWYNRTRSQAGRERRGSLGRATVCSGRGGRLVPDFLLEIGAEEIPDWMIEPALEDFRTKFQAAFGAFGGSALIAEATPRRLILLARDLSEQAADVQTVLPGPYLSAGEQAAEGFGRKQGTTVEALGRLRDAKGERFVFHQLTKGQLATEALSKRLPGIVSSISF